MVDVLEEVKDQLFACSKEYVDIFTWTANEIPDIYLKVAYDKLIMHSDAQPIIQC